MLTIITDFLSSSFFTALDFHQVNLILLKAVFIKFLIKHGGSILINSKNERLLVFISTTNDFMSYSSGLYN